MNQKQVKKGTISAARLRNYAKQKDLYFTSIKLPVDFQNQVAQGEKY